MVWRELTYRAVCIASYLLLVSSQHAARTNGVVRQVLARLALHVTRHVEQATTADLRVVWKSARRVKWQVYGQH